MTGQGSDRGVSEVIGFVLIFALVVISWTIFQGVAVPEQNKKAEINHNERVQGDILDLRDAVIRTGTTGVSQSVTITMGADYPRRTIMVNFAVTGGFIETRNPAPDNDNTLFLKNVRALDGETRDYLSGELTFRTKSIVYRPVYTRYQDAPDTVVAGGGGAVFNQFDRANLSIGDQILINDRTITIVTLNGSLSKAKGGEGTSVSLDTEPLSVSTNTVTIEDTGTDINITIPTRFDDATWNESSLAEEFGGNGRIKRIERPNTNYVSIILKPGTYQLRMMKVGVGTETTESSATYLTDIQTPGGSVSENSSNKIIVEVRDEFNNPVDGFLVNASISRSESQIPSGRVGNLTAIGSGQTTSDFDQIVQAKSSNGRVAFNYTASDVRQSDTNLVKLNISIRTANAQEQVWVNTTVLANGGNDP